MKKRLYMLTILGLGYITPAFAYLPEASGLQYPVLRAPARALPKTRIAGTGEQHKPDYMASADCYTLHKQYPEKQGETDSTQKLLGGKRSVRSN